MQSYCSWCSVAQQTRPGSRGHIKMEVHAHNRANSCDERHNTGNNSDDLQQKGAHLSAGRHRWLQQCLQPKHAHSPADIQADWEDRKGHFACSEKAASAVALEGHVLAHHSECEELVTAVVQLQCHQIFSCADTLSELL